MIDYIQFKDPGEVPLASLLAESVSHIPSLPALRGRRFDLTPGLNIIVGPNGCGKTSLLSAVRRLYFAESVDGAVECVSGFLFSSYFNLSFPRHFDEGLFELVEMRADYSRPLFSLRKPSDIHGEETFRSMDNLLQSMDSHARSKGESMYYAILALIDAMQGRMPGRRPKDYMHFKELLDAIAQQSERSFGGNPAEWAVKGRRKTKCVLDWFARNDCGPSKLTTAVLDEPDESMDIYSLTALFDLLKSVAKLKRDQFLVSLHNVALVNALSDIKGVNIIELTPGYHKAMLDFGKSEAPHSQLEKRDAKTRQ